MDKKQWYERKYGEGWHSIVVNNGVVESEMFENNQRRTYVAERNLLGKRVDSDSLKKMGFKKV